MKKLLCKLGIHKWTDLGITHYKDGMFRQTLCIIGFYNIHCPRCGKMQVQKFSFPYGVNSPYKNRKEARIAAKNFKGIKYVK